MDKDRQTMPVRLRIGHKLTLALAALLLTTVAVAAVGISSLGDVNRRARALYDDNIRTTQTTSTLWGGLYEAEKSALQLLLGPSAAQRSDLDSELDEAGVVVHDAILALRQIHAADTPTERARVEQVAAGWEAFERLWRSGALDTRDARARGSATARVTSALSWPPRWRPPRPSRRSSPRRRPRRPTVRPGCASSS